MTATHPDLQPPSNAPINPVNSNSPSSYGTDTTPQPTGVAGYVSSAINAAGDFMALFIGILFIALGIFILIQQNDKVRNVERKIAGTAAAVNPEFAGLAVATHAVTGKVPTAKHLETTARQIKRNRQPKTFTSKIPAAETFGD